jgi:hypothetical protein
MTEETVVAATSAEQEVAAVDPSRGALVDLSPEQRSEYKKTGVLPKAPEPKKEEAAASTPEPKGESAAESEAAKSKQEHTEDPKPKTKQLSASERIRQIRETIEKLWEESEPDLTRIGQLETTADRIEERAGLKRKAAPAPASQPSDQPKPPQNYQEWRKQFKPSTWIEEYAKANPDASYEDAVAAMNDFQDDVRGQFRQAEESLKASNAQLSKKLEDAKARYGEKFDEVLDPALTKIANHKDLHPGVRGMLEESDVLPHLLFVIGDEPGGMDQFLALPPGQQARKIALHEADIKQTFEAREALKDEAKADPPAKPQTKAPPPPVEVGGRASSPEDPLASAAKANDYRRFSAEATRQALARMKG